MIVKMKTKIPLPFLAALMIGMVYISLLFELINRGYQGALSVLLVIIGLASALPSFRLFCVTKLSSLPTPLLKLPCI